MKINYRRRCAEQEQRLVELATQLAAYTAQREIAFEAILSYAHELRAQQQSKFALLGELATTTRKVGALRQSIAQLEDERKRFCDFLADLQLLRAQAADTLCGSAWMNAKGFDLAVKRYADGDHP